MKFIKLPCYGIRINLAYGSGSISSDLKQGAGPEDPEWNAAADAIEAMVLAHICAGIDVQSPAYLEGLETAVTACADKFS